MDPLQWMGAVRMSVQTADKNMIESCMFVRHKSIIKGILTTV